MAIVVQIGGDGALFRGEDKAIRLKLKKPDAWDDAVDGAYTVPDMSGWEVRFVVRTSDTASTALIDRTVDTFIGVHHPDPEQNSQRAVIYLTDDETLQFRYRTEPAYRYAFKRMDSGYEHNLAVGDIIFEGTPAYD